jgi:hypothetical protein
VQRRAKSGFEPFGIRVRQGIGGVEPNEALEQMKRLEPLERFKMLKTRRQNLDPIPSGSRPFACTFTLGWVIPPSMAVSDFSEIRTTAARANFTTQRSRKDGLS